jgi:hypothetical protein
VLSAPSSCVSHPARGCSPDSLSGAVAREDVSGGPEKGRFCWFSEQNCFVGDSHSSIVLRAYGIKGHRLQVCYIFFEDTNIFLQDATVQAQI